MIIVYCIIVFLLLVIGYSLIENRFIKTVKYVLCFDKNNRICKRVSTESAEQLTDSYTHIVQLSDVHNCIYGPNNRRLFEQIKACKPDVILITGDMINKYKPVRGEIFDLLKALAGLCPCIYSLGNHELKERERYPKRFCDYVRKVQSYGIIVSDNEKHKLTINNTAFRFASYSSDLQQYKKQFLKKELKRNVSEIPVADSDGITILLSHNPELTNLYLSTEYSVIFSGHLHGGIVRVPGWRGIISTRFVPFPKYDGGCYHLDESHVLIVSRGLGSHTIKFRLFNRPELVHAVIVTEQR